MAKRVSYFPIKIPINTLSGGVGRQAPSKRLPSEVEDMNNMFCTTERSIDKRNGFYPLEGSGYDLGISDLSQKDLWFNWFFVGDDARYLFVIDYNASSESSQLLWVYKVGSDGTIQSQVVDTSINTKIRKYITHGHGNNRARNTLRSVSVGSSLLILNTVAKAGFSSDGTDHFLFGLSGTKSSEIDFKGRKVEFQTSTTVDPEGQAELWTTSTDYVWSQKAIDTKDVNADDDSRYGIWKVKDSLIATQLPGPTTEDYWIDVNEDGVAATATITVSDASALAEAETFTIYDTHGTEHIFTIVTGNDSTTLNNVGVETAKGASNEVDAATQFSASINTGTCSLTITAVANGDGTVTLTQDLVGSAGNRDSNDADTAGFAVTNFTEGTGAIDPEENHPANRPDRWERVTTTTPDPDGGDDTVVNNYTKYIPAEDYVYPDSDKLYLGQAVSKFSDLRFPPDETDLISWNGGGFTAGTLQALYPDSGDALGRGKIYHLSQVYLGSSPGWYRVINTSDKPYLEHIRTPDEMAVIDQDRMPMQIYLNTSDIENPMWSIRKIDWEPRTSGTKKTNTGPSFFQDKDGKAQQKEIKAIAFYRDRLFLASDDTLVSSRLGKFDDLFLDDPSNITVSDPIDLNVSSNIYTPITFLQPFKDFMFLGTSGDTQYELMGSENQISPLTAEIAPTSFFPMTKDIEPLLMNNNLFFFSKGRLFIYFGSQSNTINQQAFELSKHVPNYLPSSFWSATVSSAHNTIFVVGGDNPGSKIFCYRNQIANEQIVQNAFFTFTTSGSIHSIKAIEDDLYIVKQTSDTIPKLQIQKLSLIPEGASLPRLDNRRQVGFTGVSYNVSTNTTTFTMPYTGSEINQIIVLSPTDFANTIIDVTASTTVSNTTLTATGNFSQVTSGWVGTKYLSNVTLSDVFVRDDENNVIPGTLNLRYGIARHNNTGNYTLGVTRKVRTEQTYTFNPNVIGVRGVAAGGNVIDPNGTFKFPLMGFSSDLDITISSNFPHPMNITNIELTGKFKKVHHSLTT